MRSNERIVQVVRRVAERHQVSCAQVAIAWAAAQGPHVIPIPGTKKSAYLQENTAAAALELTPADLAELDSVPLAVGARYSRATQPRPVAGPRSGVRPPAVARNGWAEATGRLQAATG